VPAWCWHAGAHVLLITTDQQRFDTIQAAGNRHIWTPHLDWLNDGGVRFDNAYSDCPVCLPARTTIMTGRHAWRHGVMSNRWVTGACTPATSLAGRLSAAGWQTRLIGKQHHGPSPRHLMGFMAQDLDGDFFAERRVHLVPRAGTLKRQGRARRG
jgi:arylsulfatase